MDWCCFFLNFISRSDLSSEHQTSICCLQLPTPRSIQVSHKHFCVSEASSSFHSLHPHPTYSSSRVSFLSSRDHQPFIFPSWKSFILNFSSPSSIDVCPKLLAQSVHCSLSSPLSAVWSRPSLDQCSLFILGSRHYSSSYFVCSQSDVPKSRIQSWRSPLKPTEAPFPLEEGAPDP